MKKLLFNQAGYQQIFPLFLIVTAVGIISFLLISSTGPFSGGYNKLFPKSPSHAAMIIPPNCSDSLQAKINAASPGSTISLNQNCVYRETINITKSLTLDGGNVAQIRGSDIWTGWTQNGSTWISTQSVPLTNNNLNNPDNRCATQTCLYPYQIFLDGIREKLVLNPTPSAGEFSFDSGKHIILGDNPTGHTIEVTTRQNWVTGTIAPTDVVTIKNFNMLQAGDDAQDGGIDLSWCNSCGPTTGKVVISNNILSLAHGTDVDLYSNFQLLNNDIALADDFGFESGNHNNNPPPSNMLVQGNKIHDNNLDEMYNTSWGAGGEKTTVGGGNIFDSNEVYNNHGVGLWCDAGCHDETYSHNRVHDNTRVGIMYEISSGMTKIINNQVWNNGLVGCNTTQFYGDGAGIAVNSSNSTEVAQNEVAWNCAGIEILDQNRTDKPAAGTTDNNVHDNDIYSAAVSSNDYNTQPSSIGLAWDVGLFTTLASNNLGSNNHFWYSNPESNQKRFTYGPGISNFFAGIAAFDATFGGTGSTYLSDNQKATNLSQNLMPSCPNCGIPSPSPSNCNGADINKNGTVDLLDYSLVISNFNKSEPAGTNGDINGNGTVDLLDYSTVIFNFGKTGC